MKAVRLPWKMKAVWARFWMRFGGTGPLGRSATRLAALSVPPYLGRHGLARLSPRGYISPSAMIYGTDVSLGPNVFLDDRVLIYQGWEGGPVILADRVHIYRDTIIQTGSGGSVAIGAGTHIQPRCQFSAYKASIQIGIGVQIAPNCSFFPYNHGIAPEQLIRKQPLQTKGRIVVENDAWLGVGVTVLDGVRIGSGAVVGAGAVVTHDIPDGGIATGVPARVVKIRSDFTAAS